MFGGKETLEAALPAIEVKTIYAKIGDLTLERIFRPGAPGKAGLFPSGKRWTLPIFRLRGTSFTRPADAKQGLLQGLQLIYVPA